MFRGERVQNVSVEFERAGKVYCITNIPLNRLHIRKNILVCSIVRGGQAIIPSGQDELHVGDYVVVVLTHARLNDIKDIIEG